jgi:hypothetical protein
MSGVTSDLRTRPGTMLLNGLTIMFSTSDAPVCCLPLPARRPIDYQTGAGDNSFFRHCPGRGRVGGF